MAYNETPIKCYGSIIIPYRYNSGWHNSTFYIVNMHGPAVLGLPSSEQLKLLNMHCSINQQNMKPAKAKTPINKVDDFIKVFPDCFNKIVFLSRIMKLM